jgi:predicted glycosyltransferase involved in capsule biosynthesis
MENKSQQLWILCNLSVIIKHLFVNSSNISKIIQKTNKNISDSIKVRLIIRSDNNLNQITKLIQYHHNLEVLNKSIYCKKPIKYLKSLIKTWST